MENNRDILGFILLENLSRKNIQYDSRYKGTHSFYYNDKKYFFKECKRIEEIYNELIAEEIAIEFGIPCIHYDLASNSNFIGTISESFMEYNDKYTSMEQLLKKVYKKDKVEEYNNFEDICTMLSCIYQNKEIVKALMSELINIFIFDVLIGNIDRHLENYGIIENKNGIHLSKVYDNEKMLSYESINNGVYSIGIDRNDYHTIADDYTENLLSKFLNYSPSFYKLLILEKLKLINADNIEKILNRVEERIKAKIQIKIREEIKQKFNTNFCMIERTLNNDKVKGEQFHI